MDETETPAPNLVWRELDEEAVVDFLCHTKHVRYRFIEPVFLFMSTWADVEPKDLFHLLPCVFLGRRGSVIA